MMSIFMRAFSPFVLRRLEISFRKNAMSHLHLPLSFTLYFCICILYTSHIIIYIYIYTTYSVCVCLYIQKMIVGTYNLYTVYTYFQRCSRSGSFFPTPTLWVPQKGHCLICSWLPHMPYAFFWIISAMSTLLVRHCQLMLNWWFVARWFGILGSPKLKSPHQIRAIWIFLEKQLLWPTPKKNTGHQNHQFTIL